MIKHYTKFIIIIIFLSLFAVACTEKNGSGDSEQYKTLFLDYNDFGLYIEGNADFIYNKVDHQIFQSGDKLKFYISNDAATKFCKLNFSIDPNNGSEIISTVVLSNDEYNAVKVKFEVVKSDEAKLWLWDATASIGVVILK